MKCPKCGYNSFESHDSCKKCSSDLTGYKQTYGITPIVLPLEIREKLAEEIRAASVTEEQHVEQAEPHEDMFALDLPEDAAGEANPFNDDPFNFDDEPAPAADVQKQPAMDDPFADLLESTPQISNQPFSTPAAGFAAPAEPKPAAATSVPGEFDLDSFSWDDTPAETPAGKEEEALDDFDSLFGDAIENNKK